MKFFAASLSTETNTFAAAPTGRGSFEEHGIYRGNGSSLASEGCGALLRCLHDATQADGHTMVESIAALAQPSGRTVRAVYEDLRDQILDDLRAALPVDAVQLFLHGAMVAEGYDDCEPDQQMAQRCRIQHVGVEDGDRNRHYSRPSS